MEENHATHPLIRFILWGLLPYALGIFQNIAKKLIRLVHSEPLRSSLWSPFDGLFLSALFTLILYLIIANERLFEKVKFAHVLLCSFAVSFGGYLLQNILFASTRWDLSILPYHILCAFLFSVVPAVGAVIVKYLIYRHKKSLLGGKEVAQPFLSFVLWSLLAYVPSIIFVIILRADTTSEQKQGMLGILVLFALIFLSGFSTLILYLVIANNRLFENVKFVYILLCTVVMSFGSHFLTIFGMSDPWHLNFWPSEVNSAFLFSVIPAVVAVVVKYLIYRHKKKKAYANLI